MLCRKCVSVWVFDVGQGDAILIDTGDKQMLIDGGPSAAVVEKITAVLPFWDRKIDIILNTHPHADHYTGLIEVLKRYKVERVITSGQSSDSSGYQTFVNIASQLNMLTYVSSGDFIDLDEQVALQVLWPKTVTGQKLKDPNAGSVVLLLEYIGTRVLLTGDAGYEQEQFLQIVGDVDVLKVGHHGSAGSTASAFLRFITPEYSIISSGEGNSYGHPSPLTLDRLRAMGSEIFRTDQHGDIRILIGKNGYTVKSFDL